MTSERFERALALGRVHFQRREWSIARDVWEAGAAPEGGLEGRLLRALAWWADGIVQHHKGHGDASRALVLKALAELEALEGVEEGAGAALAQVDVEGLHDAVVRSLEGAGAPWSAKHHTWPAEADDQDGVDLEHRARCPYCNEPVVLVVAAEDSTSSRYVEDCPVCCRPWDVTVRGGEVTLGRDDGAS